MAAAESIKSKNTLITAASIAAALALDALIARRGRQLRRVAEQVPDTAGELLGDLRRGVGSAVGKAGEWASGDRGDGGDGGDGRGEELEAWLDELADRREQRRERRERRRKAS